MVYIDDLEIEDKIYCYEGTKVLKNKLNIKDETDLSDAEREIVAIKFTDLYQHPIKGNLDFEHYKTIYKRLFCDLYPFAGKVRECDIFKHNYFCFSQYINVCAEDIFNSFRSKKYFINYNYEEKIELIARLYSDLNALHSFREGNGRVVREFIEEVSKINGIDLDLSTANKEELITASMESFIGKYDRLLKIFNKKSYPLTKEEQIESIDSYCNNNLANYLKNNLETNNTRSK
jgi:hypothetical protein